MTDLARHYLKESLISGDLLSENPQHSCVSPSYFFFFFFFFSFGEDPSPQAITINSMSLHSAAGNGDDEEVLDLLENGEAVDQGNSEQNTAVFYAANAGHLSTTKLLVEKGADVNRKNSEGQTPLMWAGQCCSPKKKVKKVKKSQSQVKKSPATCALFLIQVVFQNLINRKRGRICLRGHPCCRTDLLFLEFPLRAP